MKRCCSKGIREDCECFEQGYAKALDDVTKILNELCLKCPIQDDKECWCKPLEIALKEIAKLSHSPQKSEAKVDNTSNTSLRGVTKFKEVRYAKSSSPSGDTHIRKEKKA